MHKRSKLISALLLACLAVLPRIAAQDAGSAPAKSALFWKASSAKNTVYLLGSIHFGSKSMYPLPREVEDAFESSAALAVEVDINHVDMLKTQALLLERGLYPGDDVLWNHIGKETRLQIEQFCSTNGIPSAGLAKMRPWMVEIMTAAIWMAKNMDPELGIDKHFLDKAEKASVKKRVVEIESAEWQLKLLSSFPEDVQEQALAASMEESAQMPEMIRRMEQVWMSGNADRLEKLIGEYSRGPEPVRKAMLQDRNPHMADVVEQLLNGKERVFVVVGAAHLVGKDGVIAILEKRGYKVEQVSLKR